MAKFCTRCGRPLTEGEICECRKEQVQQAPVDESTVLLDEQQKGSRIKKVDSEGSQYHRQEIPKNPYQQGNQEDLHRQSTQGYQGDPYQQGNQGYQGNPYQQVNQGYQGDPYQQGNQEYQGNPYQQVNRGYQGDPYQQGNRGYQGDPYQQGSRGYQGNPYQQGNRGYQGNPYQQVNRGYQGDPYQQGNPGYQGNPYQQPGQANQWLKQKTSQLTQNTKNMFGEILPLIKHPDTTIKRICDSNSPFMGVEMIGLKSVICILLSVFTVSVIRNSLGFVGAYAENIIPLWKIIFLILVMTFGFSYIQAGIFTGITRALKGDTTLNKMMTAVGVGALIDSFMLILCAVFVMLEMPRILMAAIMVFTLISFCFYLRGYEHAVRMNSDKKVYSFVLCQILTGIAVMIVLYIVSSLLFGDMIDGIMQYGDLWGDLL